MASIVLEGRVTPQGTLELPEELRLPPGPVRISLETLGGADVPGADLSEAEAARRKAQMEAAIGCISDEEADRILACVEDEFEQVNLDEWR